MVGRDRGERNVIHACTFPRVRTREAPGLLYSVVTLCIGELCCEADTVVVGVAVFSICFLLDVGSDLWSERLSCEFHRHRSLLETSRKPSWTDGNHGT